MQTIFALATPPGKSGVAVIRLSGKDATFALTAFGVAVPVARTATLATFFHDGQVVEKALVLYFPAPASFTGEHVVEIHCHGSRAVVRRLLDLLAAMPGFRLAEPGEFSRRAFLNGKMDLTAAEGLADLIEAETQAQHKQAMRLMGGQAAGFYTSLRRSILHSLAFLEAYIDFPDEDIPDSVCTQIEDEVDSVKRSISGQLADNGASEKIRDGIYIAILGAPNAGKSSLLNLLARRDVAIVSHIAGTTRDVIEVQMDIKGYPVVLADTAGIREHADAIEQEGIRRSLERAREADIRIVVLDAAEVAGGRWHEATERLVEVIDHNTLIVINKTDLMMPSGLTQLYGRMPVLFSVKGNSGMEELMEALEALIVTSMPAEASFITRARHRKHLQAALSHLERYGRMRHEGIELRCEELRRAAVEIGSITGVIAPDEILGEIFSSFCIGK